MKRKRAVPRILPREPLTRKAKWAIFQFTLERGRKAPIAALMVDYVLQAERMQRVDLYAWLEARGFRWTAKRGVWDRQGDA